MTTKDLIEMLSGLDPDKEICVRFCIGPDFGPRKDILVSIDGMEDLGLTECYTSLYPERTKTEYCVVLF